MTVHKINGKKPFEDGYWGDWLDNLSPEQFEKLLDAVKPILNRDLVGEMICFGTGGPVDKDALKEYENLFYKPE